MLHVQDVLEWRGEDIREYAFTDRRKQLNLVLTEWDQQWKLHGGESSEMSPNPDFFQQEMFAIDEVVTSEPATEAPPTPFQASRLETASNWESFQSQLKHAPAIPSEGIILRHIASPYPSNSESSSWWRWLPRAHKAYLVLAGIVQPTPGKRSERQAYMFAILEKGSPVLVGNTTEGMDATTTEMLQTWIPKNTTKKQGPVHFVKPEHVFEVAFQDLAPSPRSAANFKLKHLKIL